MNDTINNNDIEREEEMTSQDHTEQNTTPPPTETNDTEKDPEMTELPETTEALKPTEMAEVTEATEAPEVTEPIKDPEETKDPEITEVTGITEAEEISIEEETEEEEVVPIEAGEFTAPQKKEEEEEIQPLHTKHRKPEPVIDHRLLAGKLSVYNWLSDVPPTDNTPKIVEVRFKNTRKAFFNNPTNIPLKEGDIVAVEAALGHDIGIVSLTGELVKDQMRIKRVDVERNPLKKVYRKAKPHDIEKWQQAISLEHDTMIRSRKIAADLKLNMKIGDVEYQGDKTKAIFYYIADDRVDFRTLIKVLADTFHIRIEMKQIGTRQEAGRIGGIGPCGRKLCCSTFITNFVSVSTSAARYQDISLNPQKLAGQCGKLKCCLNYEVDCYVDAQKDFPPTNIPLNTGEGMLYHQKTDIFGRCMSYTPDKEGKGLYTHIPVKRVKEIIALNRKGIIPPKAVDTPNVVKEDIKYTDGVGEESLSRFDDKRQSKRRNSKHRNNNNRQNGNNNAPRNEKNEKNGNENNRGNNNRPNNNRGQRPQKNGPKPEQRREPKALNKQKPKTDQNAQPKNEQ